MNKSEKNIVAAVAVIMVICIAAITAASFLYKPSYNEGKRETAVSVSDSINNSGSDADKDTKEGSSPAESTGKVSDTGTSAAVGNDQITPEEAKTIALKDCGKDESSVTFKKSKLDRDNGIYKYEIEFHDGVTEYEYDINAQTGEVISRSSEPYDYD